MKTQKATGLILFLGILLILSGIIAGKAAYIKAAEMNGHFGMGKIVVTQKNVAMNNSNSITVDRSNTTPITARDIERLKKTIGITDISYSSSIKTSIQGNNRNADVEITGTSTVYSKFSRMHFAAGSFFTEKAEMENSRVAVIDAKLALKLFNSLEVVGNKISIFNQNFSIIGVLSNDTSLVESLIDNDMHSIYVPGSTFFELNNAATITHIEIKSPKNNIIGNNSKLLVKELEGIGKNPRNYNIVDFNIQEALIRQKPEILIFLVGFISIIILILYIKREIGGALRLIIREAKSDYISSVLRARIYEIILLVIKTAATAVFAIIIWKLIKFSLYVPPEYIPTDLTDLGYFKDLIHNNITMRNSDLGYIASRSEQILDAAQSITNIGFIVSLFAGFIIFYTGIYQARILKTDIFKLLIQAGISLLISTIILTGLTFYFDMDFYAEITTFVVLWIFISANAVRFGSISEKADGI